MKRRWRRLAVTITAAILTLCLVVIGVGAWLYHSGRLITLSQALLQRLSGQEVAIGTIESASWNTVVLTNLRLSSRLPGWRLEVRCPRLKARFGLLDLINKQVEHLHLDRLQVELWQSDIALAAVPGSSHPRTLLPWRRLTLQHGTLRLHWRNQAYTWQQLEATLRQQRNGSLHLEASGSLDNQAAVLQVDARTVLGAAPLTGSLHLRTTAVPLSRLAKAFAHLLPSTLKLNRGTLNGNAELTFQAQTWRAALSLELQQVTAQVQGTTIQNITLATQAKLEADPVPGTFHIKGEAQAQASKVTWAPAIVLTRPRLTAPWRLSITPTDWHLTATPVLSSDTMALGTRVHLTHLSLTTPLQVQQRLGGLMLQGTPNLRVQSLHLRLPGQTGTTLRITDLQGRFTARRNAMTLEVSEARLQTQAWYWQATQALQLLKQADLRGAARLDLQRQRLTVRQATATLPELGSLNGTGVWHWPSDTLHDLHLQLTSQAVGRLWRHLKDLMPATYPDWQLDGHTSLQVRAERLVLRPPRHLPSLALTWEVDDLAFSAADGTYAGEQLQGTLQAAVSLNDNTGNYAIHGTLTLPPFALLIGHIYPALQEHDITSVLTFSGLYDAAAARLQVYLASQWRDLATLTLKGTIQQPFKIPRYNLRLHLGNVRANRVWSVMFNDAAAFPTWSQITVQGRLDALLRLQGRALQGTARGTLDLSNLHLHTAAWELRGVSLLLPLQTQYPLPQTTLQAADLPAEAYGHLSIDRVRLGALRVADLSADLALRSDTLWFQQEVQFPLLGGQVVLEHIVARHLIRPHRRVTLRVRLRHLDLQRWPRRDTALPLVGRLNGDFSRLQLSGERLEAHGALHLALAGGTIRLFDLQGSNLFSAFPTLRGALMTEQPLSLLRLTQLYPIGDISGTLHVSVTDITLAAGELETFTLDFAVQEKGGERRAITLRALNNLLSTTGSAKVASGLIGDTYHLPYKRFGATITLRHDTLRLRGKYHDRHGHEYFMQAPALWGGVSIINRVPDNGIPFQDFVQRLTATVLEGPNVEVK
ncbi:hypothetical protein NKDENANG_02593 [Candidatus Entotheonellaceae bacterium PAL068K]